jgi:hypothetical protein
MRQRLLLISHGLLLHHMLFNEWVHSRLLVGFMLLDLRFYMYFLQIIVCPFVPFLLAIVLSVLWLTDSDYSFGIFKFFLDVCSEYSNKWRFQFNGNKSCVVQFGVNTPKPDFQWSINGETIPVSNIHGGVELYSNFNSNNMSSISVQLK